MMLGWGLRGFIGGGPFGAMIPGAMVCLALSLFHPRQNASLLAAFAAIGVGFGGEMTYGQTVGFIVKADTFWWGFLGLALKGGIWGALAGPFLALGLYAWPRMVLVSSFIAIAATEVGWRFINHPKLIYFSNPHDKPREEIWAGFLLAALAVTVFLRLHGFAQPATRLALAGFIGGFIGFGLGGAIQGLGRIFTPQLNLHWWKYMEFFFGFSFGYALAWAFRHSELPPDQPSSSAPRWLEFAAAIAATAYLFYSAEALPFRYGYLLAALPLLYLATRFPWLAKHLAYSITFTAFAFDLARYWSREYLRGPALPAYALAILASLVFAYLVHRHHARPRQMLELLTWSGVVVATLKFAIHPTGLIALLDHVALAFVLMAAWISWAIRQPQAGNANSSAGTPSHSVLSNPSLNRTPSPTS
jgi:hypothetical protein